MSECCVGVFVLKLCNKKKGFTKIKQPRIYKTHISDIISLILGWRLFYFCRASSSSYRYYLHDGDEGDREGGRGYLPVMSVNIDSLFQQVTDTLQYVLLTTGHWPTGCHQNSVHIYNYWGQFQKFVWKTNNTVKYDLKQKRNFGMV